MRAGIVTLSWDADTWSETTFYMVTYWRYHTSQFQYVMVLDPSVTFLLPDGQTYCICVTATNASGQTSLTSDTLFFQVPAAGLQ